MFCEDKLLIIPQALACDTNEADAANAADASDVLRSSAQIGFENIDPAVRLRSLPFPSDTDFEGFTGSISQVVGVVPQHARADFSSFVESLSTCSDFVIERNKDNGGYIIPKILKPMGHTISQIIDLEYALDPLAPFKTLKIEARHQSDQDPIIDGRILIAGAVTHCDGSYSSLVDMHIYEVSDAYPTLHQRRLLTQQETDALQAYKKADSFSSPIRKCHELGLLGSDLLRPSQPFSITVRAGSSSIHRGPEIRHGEGVERRYLHASFSLPDDFDAAKAIRSKAISFEDLPPHMATQELKAELGL